MTTMTISMTTRILIEFEFDLLLLFG